MVMVFFRITSYNVCYTKLLRCISSPIDNPRAMMLLSPTPPQSRKAADSAGASVSASRITSYNVCYTKLLREVRGDPKVREAYLGSGAVTDRSRGTALGEFLEPVIEVEKVNAGYGAVPVLRDTDLQVNAGELVAVLGANGAGKSTLMRVLSGLHRPVDGKIP